MAPPRAVKKSSTTALQTASCQGRNARNQVADDVDDETQIECTDLNDEVEDDEPDSSQATGVQNVILQGYQNQKRRHAVNKKKVRENYSQTKTDLQDSIITLFNKHEDQADAVHRVQLTRLAELLAHKAALESQMTTKLAHLRAAYDAHSKELSFVVDSRIEELK